MIHSILSVVLVAALTNAQTPPDCGGDFSLGCMTTADCTAFGATVTCINIDPVTSFGCCNAATTTTTTTTTAATTTTNTTCVDLLNPLTGVSDCPSRASLCTNSVYLAVMTQQCPRTCGFCSTTSTSTSTSCVDLTNPLTGVSDCPSRASLCSNSVYYSLMTTQCPRTCGRCNTTTTTTTTTNTTSTCVDLTNARTGLSECTAMRAYCTNTIYQPLMRIQCPATCGFCTSG